MKSYSINTERVTWEVADGEAVVVHFESSAYYALNPAGTYIFALLAERPAGIIELGEKLAAAYGKNPAEIAGDLEIFLEKLTAEDLITDRSPAGAPAAAPARTAPGGAYSPPELTRFGELEKLILSGE